MKETYIVPEILNYGCQIKHTKTYTEKDDSEWKILLNGVCFVPQDSGAWGGICEKALQLDEAKHEPDVMSKPILWKVQHQSRSIFLGQQICHGAQQNYFQCHTVFYLSPLMMIVTSCKVTGTCCYTFCGFKKRPLFRCRTLKRQFFFQFIALSNCSQHTSIKLSDISGSASQSNGIGLLVQHFNSNRILIELLSVFSYAGTIPLKCICCRFATNRCDHICNTLPSCSDFLPPMF